MHRKVFSKTQLENKLECIVGKTLGEVDVNHVFARTLIHPKITGIAGDVIEQSVLGMKPDSFQIADIIVDGIETEIKTTGIRKSKKNGEFKYEAKEPMSITAVSPENIINEEFLTSHFWNKLDDMLIIYYEYASDTTVAASEYSNFPIRGYDFHKFSAEDRTILKNDWLLVQGFIKNIQNNTESPEVEYPRLSSELRNELMFIDTAPKWPNRPRFRLKRSTVSAMMQSSLGKKQETLPIDIDSMETFDKYLGELTDKYNGKSVSQLLKQLNITFSLNSKNEVSKSITEQITVGIFGGKAKKLSDIEIFNKMGLITKTITQTKKGKRTEDIKMFKIDFDEWTDDTIPFEKSYVYDYLIEQQFLCVIFEEQNNGDKLLDKKFIGFKRMVLPLEIIETEVKIVWESIRNLIREEELIETVILNKIGVPRVTPKTNKVMTSINFPKSADFNVFVRGSSSDATYKPERVNGIDMYAQYIWIKGELFLDILNQSEYLE